MIGAILRHAGRRNTKLGQTGGATLSGSDRRTEHRHMAQVVRRCSLVQIYRTPYRDLPQWDDDAKSATLGRVHKGRVQGRTDTGASELVRADQETENTLP